MVEVGFFGENKGLEDLGMDSLAVYVDCGECRVGDCEAVSRCCIAGFWSPSICQVGVLSGIGLGFRLLEIVHFKPVVEVSLEEFVARAVPIMGSYGAEAVESKESMPQMIFWV
jgi:hypothetical protein